MRLPLIQGLIDRRMLVNYRVDPDVLAAQLPAPFRPQIVGGWGVAGICLIRLRHIRPQGWPAWMGISSENAAHRIAVTWSDQGVTRTGVYIHRRDSSGWLNTLAGGRVFPGIHHHARFTVREQNDDYFLEAHSDDNEIDICVRGRLTDQWPATSVFESVSAASDFFAAGSLGYSATTHPGRHQGLELCCRAWHVEPLAVEQVRSSYFDCPRRFPPGSIALDNALLMRGIEHQWRGRADLCCDEEVAPASC
jgi:hypothetical protein